MEYLGQTLELEGPSCVHLFFFSQKGDAVGFENLKIGSAGEFVFVMIE